MSGVCELSNEDLYALENSLFNSLDKLKFEKAGRVYKSEIQTLKQKLGA